MAGQLSFPYPLPLWLRTHGTTFLELERRSVFPSGCTRLVQRTAILSSIIFYIFETTPAAFLLPSKSSSAFPIFDRHQTIADYSLLCTRFCPAIPRLGPPSVCSGHRQSYNTHSTTLSTNLTFPQMSRTRPFSSSFYHWWTTIISVPTTFEATKA